MRSRRSGGPLAVEVAFRCLGIASVVALIWILGFVRAGDGEHLNASSSTLRHTLGRATRAPAASVGLELTHPPSPAERDWLLALRRGGMTVAWRPLGALSPSALAVEPVAGPSGTQRVSLLAPVAGYALFADAAGSLDSVTLSPGGVANLTASLEGSLHARLASGAELVARPNTVSSRRVLVLGRADWEAKFATAALAESGWTVDARFVVAPGVDVTQGQPESPDTSRYAAVVLLDTGIVQVRALQRYARGGGGVILASNASTSPDLLALAGVARADRVHAELGALASSNPVQGLVTETYVVRDSAAVVLERRGLAPIVVARRVGAGRVMVSALRESWRWRMQGGDGAAEAHRTWWSSAISRVAYASQLNDSRGSGLDGAPLAGLNAALGPPAPQGWRRNRPWTSWLTTLTFLLALASLSGEWASRRLRGAR